MSSASDDGLEARVLVAVETPWVTEDRVREIVREELKVMLDRGIRVGESRVSVGEIVDEVCRRERLARRPEFTWDGDREPAAACHCGFLGWTVEKWGRVAHKHGCPARVESWCQAHPDGCPRDAEPEPLSPDSEFGI